MLFLEIVFWASVALLVHTHVTYPAALWAIVRLRGQPGARAPDVEPPHVSLIVAAHDEEAVIERKVRNALALDYPRERLELIVASDGSTDRTVELAREAGADLVLDLGRGGKIAAQNAAAARTRGDVLAFSDANAFWAPDALRRLVAPFADPRVGYVCGQVRFTTAGGSNEEGTYWRYEMAVRGLESRLGGITAGNGAIYAVRRDAYIVLDPSRSHDLSFPFELVKRGRRALYAPDAVAEERMVPTLRGEFARKRRMMSGLWGIVLRDGMLSIRGYGPMYAFEIYSHRVLRYASWLLHLVTLATNVALVGQGAVYRVTLAAQAAFLLAAALAPLLPLRPLRLARYYVLVTASVALGLWDRMRGRVPRAWEKAEGTR
ncbi:MAG TPA: glycosyltransferase family 2 protein [Solirubrobacterales bacterium]|nr:glycosyltransferase family 2 protein [Solirubrobacterales bacterium]